MTPLKELADVASKLPLSPSPETEACSTEASSPSIEPVSPSFEGHSAAQPRTPVILPPAVDVPLEQRQKRSRMDISELTAPLEEN